MKRIIDDNKLINLELRLSEWDNLPYIIRNCLIRDGLRSYETDEGMKCPYSTFYCPVKDYEVKGCPGCNRELYKITIVGDNDGI